MRLASKHSEVFAKLLQTLPFVRKAAWQAAA
jgi:hypothetical protein